MTAVEEVPLEVWSEIEATRIANAARRRGREARVVPWWDGSYRVSISGPEPLEVWTECWVELRERGLVRAPREVASEANE